MLRTTASLALLLCAALGGCRTDIELSPDEETDPDDPEEPTCEALLEPRVDDCVRAAPDAVPIAELPRSHVLADDGYLYFTGFSQVFRLAMAGGEPEALTPPGSVHVNVRYLDDGFLYWKEEDVVHRVPTTGGEPEALVEVVGNALWAPADQAIVWSGPYPEPGPVHRTSLATGDTTEIMAADPEQFTQGIAIHGERAIVALSRSLVSVPLEGGEPQVLVGDVGMSGLVVTNDGQAYFGGSFSPGPIGVYRVDMDQPSSVHLVVLGLPVAIAFDDAALYAHVIPDDATVEKTYGRIVRVPLSGGDAAFLSGTSSWTAGGKGFGPYGVPSDALVVSGCNVYFIEECTDLPGDEGRLVTMSKLP